MTARPQTANLLAGIAAAACVTLVAVSLLIIPAWLLTHAIHETGHGLACTTQGGTVADWWAALRPSGSMDCPTINVITTIGGAVFQLFVWITLTLAFTSWASYWRTANGWQAALILFWLAWSFWNVR
jgi:hypothetical protein